MKIDFIYDCVYPFSKGGAERRNHDHARFLAQDHHNRVRLISMQWWKKDMVQDHVHYHAIAPYRSINDASGQRSVKASLLFAWRVFLYARMNRDIDVMDIQIFPYFPVLFARLAFLGRSRRPKIVVYWCECLDKDFWKKTYGLLWWVGMALEKLCYCASDQIITDSHFTKRKLQKRFSSQKRIIDVLEPVSIDLSQIENNRVQQKEYDIISYGRLSAHKHVEHIVMIMKRLIDEGHRARALIIGEGPERDHIEKMIVQEGLSQYIDIRNFVEEYSDLIHFISSARIMINPSEREGFGITTVESHACGLPVLVVAYPENAMIDLVHDGVDGFVCKDVEELFSRTKELLFGENVEYTQVVMGARARDAAQQFTRVTMQKKVQKYYENLTHNE